MIASAVTRAGFERVPGCRRLHCRDSATDRALATFKATRDANAVAGYRERVRAFEDFMGYREFSERARRYGAT